MIDPAQEVIRQVKEKLTIGKLDSVHDRASHSTTPYLFFRSLIEYVSLFEHSEILNAIAQAIVEEGRNQRAPIDELQKITLQEMQHACVLIKEFVVQNTITDGEIAFSLELLEGQVASTSHPVEARYQALNDILHMLVTDYFLQSKLFLAQFAKITEAPDHKDNVIISTTYSSAYKDWHQAHGKYQRQKLTEDWFSWQEIYDLYQTYHDYEAQRKELSETGKTLEKIFHSHTFQRIDRLVNDTNQTPDNIGAMELYRSYLVRVHFHAKSLLAGLEQNDTMITKEPLEKGYTNKVADAKITPSLHFNTKSGVLDINNRQIKFREKRRRLLGLIMSNPKKKWSYDEIYITLDNPDMIVLKARVKRKIFYRCRDINDRLAVAVEIKDFLLYKDQIVQVNPIYIT